MKKDKSMFFRILKFGIVGTSGVFVNQGIFILCTRQFNIDYRISSLIAIQTAITSNFLLNYFWTWNDRRLKRNSNVFSAFLKFNASSFITAFVFNWITLVFLTEILHIQDWISNLAGISVAAAVNFCVSNFWVFKTKI